MNDFKLQIGFGIAALLAIAIGFFFYGNARYDSGQNDKQNEWLLKIANEPVKRDTTWKHDTTHIPPQLMSGYGIYNLDSILGERLSLYDSLLALKDNLSLSQELLGQAIEEKVRLGEQVKAEVVLRDSIGGTHEIRFDYGSRLFSERYTMSPTIRDLLTIHERQTLTYETRRRWLVGFSADFHREPGYGVILGVKPLQLGISYYPESKSFAERVQGVWEF